MEKKKYFIRFIFSLIFLGLYFYEHSLSVNNAYGDISYIPIFKPVFLVLFLVYLCNSLEGLLTNK